MKRPSELLLNDLERACVGTKSDLQNAFVRAAGPEKDGVDWVGRRLDADIPQCDVEMVRSDLLANGIQNLATEALGRLELGACRRAESQLKGFHATGWKDLPAKCQSCSCKYGNRNQEIERDHEAAHRSEALEECGEPVAQTFDPISPVRCLCLLIAVGPQPPDGQHRKQRAREKKRRDHRESHRQRQRHEERSRDAGHEERWHEHRDDR